MSEVKWTEKKAGKHSRDDESPADTVEPSAAKRAKAAEAKLKVVEEKLWNSGFAELNVPAEDVKEGEKPWSLSDAKDAVYPVYPEEKRPKDYNDIEASHEVLAKLFENCAEDETFGYKDSQGFFEYLSKLIAEFQDNAFVDYVSDQTFKLVLSRVRVLCTLVENNDKFLARRNLRSLFKRVVPKFEKHKFEVIDYCDLCGIDRCYVHSFDFDEGYITDDDQKDEKKAEPPRWDPIPSARPPIPVYPPEFKPDDYKYSTFCSLIEQYLFEKLITDKEFVEATPAGLYGIMSYTIKHFKTEVLACDYMSHEAFVHAIAFSRDVAIRAMTSKLPVTRARLRNLFSYETENLYSWKFVAKDGKCDDCANDKCYLHTTKHDENYLGDEDSDADADS